MQWNKQNQSFKKHQQHSEANKYWNSFECSVHIVLQYLYPIHALCYLIWRSQDFDKYSTSASSHARNFLHWGKSGRTSMIKPNLSCKLKIKDYNNKQALMIPMRIIKENASGEKYIFKLKPDGKNQVYRTEKTFIQLGKNSIDKVEVLVGIQSGDLLVDEGATIVENNQRVKNIQ